MGWLPVGRGFGSAVAELRRSGQATVGKLWLACAEPDRSLAPTQSRAFLRGLWAGFLKEQTVGCDGWQE